jgi:hypothetical protein
VKAADQGPFLAYTGPDYKLEEEATRATKTYLYDNYEFFQENEVYCQKGTTECETMKEVNGRVNNTVNARPTIQ